MMEVEITLDRDDMEKLNKGGSVEVLPGYCRYDNLTKFVIKGVKVDGERKENNR